jgi:hypothetical protein
METTKEVYESIMSEHFGDLKPYSSYTNPEGNDGIHYLPQIYTAWGFKDGNCEIVACKATKDFIDQEKWDFKYYIAKSIISE